MSRGDEPVRLTGAENGERCVLTIREHFAAMAMQGLLANPLTRGGCEIMQGVAMSSAQLADALLAELAKEATHAVHRGEP